MAGIKDIVKQMDDAGKAFDGVITKSEKALYDAALTSVKDLELDSQGNIKTTTANLKRLQSIKMQLAKAAGGKEYLKGVKELSDVFDRIYNRQQAFYYRSAFPEKTMGMNTKSRLELMRQVAVQNTIEGLTGAGLAANVTDPLNGILLRAVTSGAKYSDLTKELRDSIISSPQGEGTLARYAKTYATTALTQYAGQNNKLFTDDLGASWFRYVGSEIETTREFCQLMLQKEYIHRSEFAAILKGEITINGKVHKCKMNPKTGLPQGMIDGTNEDNLQVNVGGWNCRHQLVPVAAAAVPQDIREAVESKLTEPEPKPEPQKQSAEEKSFKPSTSFVDYMTPDFLHDALYIFMTKKLGVGPKDAFNMINTLSVEAQIYTLKKMIEKSQFDDVFKDYYQLHALDATGGQVKEIHDTMNDTPQEISVIRNKQHGYVSTTNYRKINGMLRDKSLEATMTEEELKENRNTITTMDKLINDNTTPINLVAHRMVDEKFLLGALGAKIDPNGTLDDWYQSIQFAKGKVFQDKAFTSVSLDKENNIFSERPVYIKFLVPKGTHMYVTNNYIESEAVLMRGQDYEITDIKKTDGRIEILAKLL